MESDFAAAVDAERAGDEDAVWEILSSVVHGPDASDAIRSGERSGDCQPVCW